MLSTRPGFDAKLIAEVTRRERVGVRGLERQEAEDGGRIVLVAKLSPWPDWRTGT